MSRPAARAVLQRWHACSRSCLCMPHPPLPCPALHGLRRLCRCLRARCWSWRARRCRWCPTAACARTSRWGLSKEGEGRTGGEGWTTGEEVSSPLAVPAIRCSGLLVATAAPWLCSGCALLAEFSVELMHFAMLSRRRCWTGCTCAPAPTACPPSRWRPMRLRRCWSSEQGMGQGGRQVGWQR